MLALLKPPLPVHWTLSIPVPMERKKPPLASVNSRMARLAPPARTRLPPPVLVGVSVAPPSPPGSAPALASCRMPRVSVVGPVYVLAPLSAVIDVSPALLTFRLVGPPLSPIANWKVCLRSTLVLSVSVRAPAPRKPSSIAGRAEGHVRPDPDGDRPAAEAEREDLRDRRSGRVVRQRASVERDAGRAGERGRGGDGQAAAVDRDLPGDGIARGRVEGQRPEPALGQRAGENRGIDRQGIARRIEAHQQFARARRAGLDEAAVGGGADRGGRRRS